jgi:hypothetical protein
MDRPALTAALIEGPCPLEGAVFEDNVCRVAPFLFLQFGNLLKSPAMSATVDCSAG